MSHRTTASAPASSDRCATYGPRGLSICIVLALALSAGVGWAGCGIAERADEDAGQPDLLAHLPAGAAVVGWADLAAVREADPLGAWQEGGPADELRDGLPEIEAMTGIDLEHDLHAAAVAATRDEPGPLQGHPVFVLLASYDADRVAAALDDASRHDHRGHSVYVLTAADSVTEPGADPDPAGAEEAGEEADAQAADEADAPAPDDADAPAADEADMQAADGADDADRAEDADRADRRDALYLALPAPELLLVGSREGVEAALDAGDGESASARQDLEITELVDRVPAGREAWVVVTRRALQGRLGELPDTTEVPIPRSVIQDLLGLVVSADLGDGLDATVDAIAAEEEGAGLLVQSLQGMLALGKMALQQQDPELFSIVDRAVSISQDGSVVRAHLRLSSEDLAALRSRLDERARTAPAQGASGASVLRGPASRHRTS